MDTYTHLYACTYEHANGHTDAYGDRDTDHDANSHDHANTNSHHDSYHDADSNPYLHTDTNVYADSLSYANSAFCGSERRR